MKNKRAFGLLLVFLFLSFMLYGLFFNAFGANAKLSMSFFQIREARQGLILTVQAVVGFAVTLFLSLYGERFNKLRAVALGLMVMAAASLLIGGLPLLFPQGAGYPVMLALYAAAGVGAIIIDVLMNGVITEVYPERKDTFLPYVHAFYGVGAMLAPLFVTAVVQTERPESFAVPYALLGAIGLATLLPLALLIRRLNPQTVYADKAALRSRATGRPAEVFHTKKAWLLLGGSMFFLFFQTGVSTWLPAFCTEYLRFDYVTGARVVSLYFLGALAMRFLSPVIYRRMGAPRFFTLSVLLSFALFLVCFLARLPNAAFVALVTVGGFTLGASVPSLIILCCDAFPTRTASASGIVVISVSLSSLIVPTVMGWMMQTLGYLAPMLTITACLPLSVLLVRRAIGASVKLHK